MKKNDVKQLESLGFNKQVIKRTIVMRKGDLGVTSFFGKLLPVHFINGTPYMTQVYVDNIDQLKQLLGL